MEIKSYEADELGQYRSLSTMAVLAMVLGLCSALSFASPLMVIVPLAAIAMAILALKGIAASDGGLTGDRLAYAGIALAIFFGVGSYVRVQVRDYLLKGQAEEIALEWLSLAAEGRSDDMLALMTKASADKLSPAVEPGQPMPFFGGIMASALLRQDPVVAKLAELKKSGTLNLQLIDAGVSYSSRPPQVGLNYTISDSADQKRCSLLLKRYRAVQDEQVWLIDDFRLD